MDQEKLWRAIFAREHHYSLRRGFIDEAERGALVAWARRMAPRLNANGEARAYAKTDRLAPPPVYTEVRQRLQRLLGIGDAVEPEPHFGWYLSIIGAGGFVHAHRDPTPEGTRHLRCNLFLQLPHTGGRPIIEAVPFDMAPGDLLIFVPSERLHRSEPVIGRRRRIILSFGYTVPGDYCLPPR